MALNDYTFKGVTAIGRDLLTENVLHGVMDFYRWGLLMVGGFQNVTLSPNPSGVFGGNRTRLRPASVPGYTDGTVWEGFRSDWVWETGINNSLSMEPIRVSGIYINGSFSGINAVGYVDYPKGRVILNSPLPTTTNITCEFSTRYASVVAKTDSWFRQFQVESYRVDSTDFLSASGQWAIPNEVKRQLPVVGLEPIIDRNFSPFQIGGGQWARVDVLFYIIAENSFDRNQLTDIITMQNDRTIWLPNRGLMKSDPRYPVDLDYRGTPVNNSMMYPDIIQDVTVPGSGGFQWRKVNFNNTRATPIGQIHPDLFGAIVRTTVEIIMPEI